MGERQILPWQIKSIFIMVLFLLDLPRNALVCKGFRGFVKCVFLLASWQNRARWCKLLRAVSSKIGSKTKILTTKDFPPSFQPLKPLSFSSNQLFQFVLIFVIIFCQFTLNTKSVPI